MTDQMAVIRALLAQRLKADASWAERRAQMDAFGAAAPLPEGWRTHSDALGRPAERHHGPGIVAGRAMLYLHGGGYCLGSAASHRGLVAHLAQASGAEAYALDYRLAPEHPFPAAVDDAVAAWKALLARGVDPARVVIAGDSAGGGLSLACALRLKAEKLPLPAGLVLISPWLDLSQSGESYTRCAAVAPMISKAGLDQYADAYLNGASARQVFASPILGELSGLPPVLVQVGADEVLLSDSTSFGDAAKTVGLDFSVEIWPRMIHVFHAFYPMLDAAKDAIAGAGAWAGRRMGDSVGR